MAKRILTALLCLLLCSQAVILPVLASEAETFLLGDLNGDGQRTAIDYIALKRYVLGTYDLHESQKTAADLNGDVAVDAKDYMILKRVILGICILPEPALPDPPEEKPSETLMAALTFTFLLQNGSEEELLYLESVLNMELDALHSLVVGYLASVSVDGETLLELESEIALALDNPEAIEAFAASLAEMITEWLLSALQK